MKVYVAGASAELDRVRGVMDFIREQPRLELARDWVADVERERIEGGRTDSDLAPDERKLFAGADLGAVAESDIFWLLSPMKGTYTTGAWVELGAALVTGHMRQALGLSKTVVLISGQTAGQHLFSSLADYCFDLDFEARDWLFARCGS